MEPVTKHDMVRAVEALPEGATVEDAIERLILLDRVARGLDESRRGEGKPVGAFRAEVASWRK